MTRVRSTDVWFNAPGIQAAYQPIAAPDPFAARQNVGNDGRMAGRNVAMPGVAPTWSSATGWQFDGTTQYLNTAVIPQKNTSALVAFKNAQADTSYLTFFGAYGNAGVRFTIGNRAGITGPYFTYGNAEYGGTYQNHVNGVAGLSAGWCYFDGRLIAAIGTWSGAATLAIYIGAYNPPAWLYVPSSIQRAVMISQNCLTPAHMAQYSRQMAYCHVNPDWSAWGRRRQYYYAPSAAAAALWRGVGRNSSPVGGSLGIGRTP